VALQFEAVMVLDKTDIFYDRLKNWLEFEKKDLRQPLKLSRTVSGLIVMPGVLTLCSITLQLF
jgi:hypothetical protein